jgi:hypothetical protein
MPLNLLKRYNDHLDILGLSEPERKKSLKNVFDRDFTNSQPIHFNGRQVIPCPQDGVIEMETLFRHLTTVKIDYKTGQREYEKERSKRLHWVKHHIDGKKPNNMLFFTVKESEGLRTYLYDEEEKYVIVFEPRVNKNVYFLLSAHYIQGKDAQRDKIKKKYRRKLTEVL